MKKMFVALGIAFALFCGVMFGSMINNETAVSEKSEPVSIEEAVINHLKTNDVHGDEIMSVSVDNIVANDNYGGYAVWVTVHEYDGETYPTVISANSLGIEL